MRFKDEQIERFKKVLEKHGVDFSQYTDEKAHQILDEALTYYGTMVDIRMRQMKKEKQHDTEKSA